MTGSTFPKPVPARPSTFVFRRLVVGFALAFVTAVLIAYFRSTGGHDLLLGAWAMRWWLVATAAALSVAFWAEGRTQARAERPASSPPQALPAVVASDVVAAHLSVADPAWERHCADALRVATTQQRGTIPARHQMG